MSENKQYLSQQIITYLGNKRTLLPFIGKALKIVHKRLNKEKLTCLDLFSGSGIVARYFKQHSNFILANDLELYSNIINNCYLSNKESLDIARLNSAYLYLLEQIINKPYEGIICQHYAPKNDEHIQANERVFYTKRNAIFLDSARYYINTLDQDLQKYFLAPLLAEASVHTNTSGVFKGFYKNKAGLGQFGGQAKNALTRILKDIELKMPVFSNYNTDFLVTSQDANALAQTCPHNFDLAYFDPPYNQHPYGSNYFMLNVLAKNSISDKISPVSGITQDWNKSLYNNKKAAKESLFKAIQDCKAKFILISYNSEGFVNEQEFTDFLSKIGKLEILQTNYNVFKASRNLNSRAKYLTEFLYLVEGA